MNETAKKPGSAKTAGFSAQYGHSAGGADSLTDAVAHPVEQGGQLRFGPVKPLLDPGDDHVDAPVHQKTENVGLLLGRPVGGKPGPEAQADGVHIRGHQCFVVPVAKAVLEKVVELMNERSAVA